MLVCYDKYVFASILTFRGASTLLISLGIAILVVSFGQQALAEAWFWLSQQNGTTYTVDSSIEAQSQQDKIKLITPASTGFGLVIEKLNINEAVAAEVDPYNPKVYLPILQRSGVAQAKGAAFPGQQGTVYLFGHSTINIWEIGRYRAPFTLLNKLEAHDRIVTYYQDKRYDYLVTEKKVVSPAEVRYLTDIPAKPMLILQTCDPPGTDAKRLLVMATLVEK